MPASSQNIFRSHSLPYFVEYIMSFVKSNKSANLGIVDKTRCSITVLLQNRSKGGYIAIQFFSIDNTMALMSASCESTVCSSACLSAETLAYMSAFFIVCEREVSVLLKVLTERSGIARWLADIIWNLVLGKALKPSK